MIESLSGSRARAESQHQGGADRRVEERLQFLEEFNRLLAESSGDCVLIVDRDGLVHTINRTGRELLELENGDGLGRHWVELFQGFDSQVQLPKGKIPLGRSTFQ